jgi:hypothetical protein
MIWMKKLGPPSDDDYAWVDEVLGVVTGDKRFSRWREPGSRSMQ